MNASTHSILRVECYGSFCGSAIHLGGGYVITCWHVVVDPEHEREREQGQERWSPSKMIAKYRFEVSTVDRCLTAKVVSVLRESHRAHDDLLLLKCELQGTEAWPEAGMRLLGEVNDAFLDDPDECSGIHLVDFERIEAYGFPGKGKGDCPNTYKIDTASFQNRGQNPDTGLLTNWQLSQGGLPEGFSGGAIIGYVGDQAVCLGMPYLGRDVAATSRVTVSNKIIEFLRPVLPPDELNAMQIEAKDLLSQAEPKLIEEHRRCGLRGWGEQFYEGSCDPNEKRTGFIETQGLKLLNPEVEPRAWLRPEYFRSQRAGIPAAEPQAPRADEAWITIDRSDLVRGIVTLPDGRSCELTRMVVTTDAGVGKTTNLFWLMTRLNQEPTDRVAFLIDPAAWQQFDNSENWLERLTGLVLTPASDSATDAQERRLKRHLRRKRDEGNLVILLDGLDQATPDQVLAIKGLLNDKAWAACRIILGGRPHVLQRHWDELFSASRHWRFVQAEEFTPDEQDRYLGEFPNGTKRYSLIPPEARPILGVPRVLELLRELKDSELSELRTASEVYWKATQRLISRGLSKSAKARKLGGNLPESDQIDLAIELLSAIAFQMTSDRLRVKPSESANERGDERRLGTAEHFQPNFDRISPDGYPDFRRSVWERVKDSPWYSRKPFEDFTNDLDCLAAMNTVLSHGFFDSDTKSGLNGVLWRNRSLQEFFTAVWLSRHFTCADEYSDEDGQQLRSWVFTPDDLASEAYYEVWRYAAEMPAAGRVGKSWVRAMGSLYLPGDGTEATRRSNEMLYRSWSTMESYAEGIPDTKAIEQAKKVLAGFQGELENTILAGKRGKTLREHAQEFVGSFIELAGDPEFRMGSPEEKQGRMPEEQQKFWEEWLAEGHNDREAHVNQLLDRFTFPPGKAGARQRAEFYEFYFRIHRDRDLNALRRSSYAADETPEQTVQPVAGSNLAIHRRSSAGTGCMILGMG